MFRKEDWILQTFVKKGISPFLFKRVDKAFARGNAHNAYVIIEYGGTSKPFFTRHLIYCICSYRVFKS